MDYFGINSAEDLPKIREVLADQLVEPTDNRTIELLPLKLQEAQKMKSCYPFGER